MGLSSCKKTSSGLPLIPHYGELHNCLIIQHSVIIIEIVCTVNLVGLNDPETIPTIHQFVEKLASTKLIPGAERIGDCCPKEQRRGPVARTESQRKRNV